MTTDTMYGICVFFSCFIPVVLASMPKKTPRCRHRVICRKGIWEHAMTLSCYRTSSCAFFPSIESRIGTTVATTPNEKYSVSMLLVYIPPLDPSNRKTIRLVASRKRNPRAIVFPAVGPRFSKFFPQGANFSACACARIASAPAVLRNAGRRRVFVLNSMRPLDTSVRVILATDDSFDQVGTQWV
jgi:hypothetical protein